MLDGEIVHAQSLERVLGRKRRRGQRGEVDDPYRPGLLHGVEDRAALSQVDLETLALATIWRVTGSLQADHLVARSEESGHEPRADEAPTAGY